MARNAEERRLEEDKQKTKHWRQFGPYLAERQWATVREDYSANGDAWEYFPHDMARFRAYRWGEDGIAGFSDNHQNICFSFAFWNEKDPCLKERLFGLTNGEGNHGEDVKELYYYVDNLPSHAYMKYNYKYPSQEFPYQKLVNENKARNRSQLEYEILDTGVFENGYFDIDVEYAKHESHTSDIMIKVTVTNRSKDTTRRLHIIPTLWFRNTWSWGVSELLANHPKKHLMSTPPTIFKASSPLKKDNSKNEANLHSKFETLQTHNPVNNRTTYLYYSLLHHQDTLFTCNETNFEALYGIANKSKYTKSGLNEYIVNKKTDAVRTEVYETNGVLGVDEKDRMTKCGIHYSTTIPPLESRTLLLRFSEDGKITNPFEKAEERFQKRKDEADEFYSTICPSDTPEDIRNIQRQAYANLLWSKQFYHYSVREWLDGDPNFPKPPIERSTVGKNREWTHAFMEDILSMPDSFEYPFFAAWDLAFHTIPLSMIDPEFAKKQLILLTREWYLHPNGQIPAYEWGFNDVNPPVHAWAAYRIFKIERKIYGRSDFTFLERVFQKLLLNFTWWVNRKDQSGLNVFEGGFLGLDNIGVFNRSEPLPTGGKLCQADGTSWVAMYCLNMLDIALELALVNRSYEDIASKFFEHFLYISDAMTHKSTSLPLWHNDDGYFTLARYSDLLVNTDGTAEHLTVRSFVGIIPLFACLVIEKKYLDALPEFRRRMDWFLQNRSDLTTRNIASLYEPCGSTGNQLLALVEKNRLTKIMERILDPKEFWSPFGVRSLSKYHEKHPYVYTTSYGQRYTVEYIPGEARSGMFGGNSNWRGPVWFPTNFLLVESLERFHYYYGDSVKFECPKGSNRMMNLKEIAREISLNLIDIFTNKSLKSGRSGSTDRSRPYNGPEPNTLLSSAEFKDLISFHEFFDPETGRGCGAYHQGWTSLVAKLIHKNFSNPKQNLLKQEQSFFNDI